MGNQSSPEPRRDRVPRDRRKAMVLKARISFVDTTVHCIVTDLSGDGMKVSSSRFTDFPEQVVIQLDGGAVWGAMRIWQRGLDVGFKFIQPAE